MGEVVANFINEFHNVEGVTVAEKKRSLYRLFHNNSSLLENQPLLSNITSQLIAQTHLERIFLVEFLIYYRRFEELLKEFMKGNEIVVSKIAKQQWFFQSAFRDVGAEFVTHVLPTLSFSLRLKILKKLVPILDEKQCDEVFDTLHSHYGIFVATNILTSCSRDKIEQILKNYPIKLWTSQLKLLYKKDPDLMYVYVEERVNHEGNSKFLNYDPIVPFIATNHPEMFCNLQEKYKFQYWRLGKRTTKKLVGAKKDNIIARADLYAHYLHPAHLFRTLGADFQRVYLKVFPKNSNEVLRSVSNGTFFKGCPKNARFNLFRNAFNQTFHNKLEGSYGLINKNLLEMITDGDEREKWVKLKQKQDGNDALLQYFKARDCIDAVMQKLNVANEAGKRIENISVMTETCLINRDWDSLITVCQLLCGRFKNDKGVHKKFLEIIANNRFAFNNFNENHWKYVREIVGRPEFRIEQHFHTTPILFKYFEFLYRRNEPLEEEITTWAKGSNWSKYLHNLNQYDPKFEKSVLLVLIKQAPHLLTVNSDTIENLDCKLILACKRYNLRSSTEKIDIFEHPRLLESVQNGLLKKNLVEKESIAPIIGWLICTKNRNEKIEEITHLYWNNFERFGEVSSIKWFVQHRPQLIVEYFDKFLSFTISNDLFHYHRQLEIRSIHRMIKCYTHLGIDQKLIEFYISKLNDESFTQKVNLLPSLSMLMPPQDFVQLVEAYKPTSATVDFLNPESNQLFQLQRYMLKSCVNVKPEEPEMVISLVMQFCSGDYVASCLSPLYSCLYKIPENRIKVFLDKLCNTQAVSVKKHGYYFACVIFDESTVLSSLQSCRLTQAIAMAYQHFVKNPSEQTWEIFKSKLFKLDKNDHFTNLLLVNTPAPKKYKSRYFETALDVFQKQNNKFTKVLLNKVQKETVGELKTQFFAKIKDDFRTMHNSDLIFTYYLLCCKDNEKFGVIFEALRTFKQQNWSLRAHEPREKLHKFVTALFNTYMDGEKHDDSLIDTFLAGFQEIFHPVEAFEEYIIIFLMKFKNQNIDLVKSVTDLNSNLVANYGKLTINILANCLNKFLLPKLYDDQANIFEFYYSLLNVKGNVDNILLVIQLLPKATPQLEKCARFYYSIVNELKKVDNETVQVHLNIQHSKKKINNSELCYF